MSCRDVPMRVEEVQRLAVTAHQDVLSVVDEIAGLGIRERVGASAERGLAFEQCDAEACSASATPALRPAKPPPMTTTSFASTMPSSLGREASRAPRPRAAHEIELRGAERLWRRSSTR